MVTRSGDNPYLKKKGTMVTRSGGNPYLKKKETRLSSFVIKRMFTKGDPSLTHTMTSFTRSSVLFHLKRDKGLMRDSM